MLTADIVDINEAARRLDKTANALRMHISRRRKQGKPLGMPTPQLELGRLVWDRKEFDEWLAARKNETHT